MSVVERLPLLREKPPRCRESSVDQFGASPRNSSSQTSSKSSGGAS
jgi:hypothetical protein